MQKRDTIDGSIMKLFSVSLEARRVGRELVIQLDDPCYSHLKYSAAMYSWGGRNGALIWKEIESKSILDGRSWESMKGRFLKHIVGNLEK